jgi:hypothetical protein
MVVPWWFHKISQVPDWARHVYVLTGHQSSSNFEFDFDSCKLNFRLNWKLVRLVGVVRIGGYGVAKKVFRRLGWTDWILVVYL